MSSQATFLEVIDDDTRGGVLRLSQKLNGLQAEIKSKLDVLGAKDDPEATQQKTGLSHLLLEVEKALTGIHELTSMLVTEEMTNEEFLKKNKDELKKFREMVSEKAQKIAEINAEF